MNTNTKMRAVTAATTEQIVCAPRQKDSDSFSKGLVTLDATKNVLLEGGVCWPHFAKAGKIFAANDDLTADNLSDWYYITEVSARLTPVTVEIGDVFTAVINGRHTVSFTATAATVANVTAGLTAAINAFDYGDGMGQKPVTASDQTTYVKLVASDAETTFSVTASAVDGGGADTQTHVVAGYLLLDRAHTINAANKAFTIGVPSLCIFTLFNAEAALGQEALYKYVYGANIPNTVDGNPVKAQYSNSETVKAHGIMVWTAAATAALEISCYGDAFKTP